MPGVVAGTMNIVRPSCFFASLLVRVSTKNWSAMCAWLVHTLVPVMLQPGKCYTFLAQSYPNVSELDLTLKPNFGNPPPPILAMFANQPIAQDSDLGPAATVGKGSQCFKNPFPIPGLAIVEVKARTGAGPVAVQVYSK